MGKNNQVNISNLRAIRSLGEHETFGETEGVRKYGRNDDENYDEDRYDSLTQFYFDMMMEDDINKKEPTSTITGMNNNIDPKAQLNCNIGRMTNDDNSMSRLICKNDLCRKIKNALRTIDKITEREMYFILRSHEYANTKNASIHLKDSLNNSQNDPEMNINND
ncbi:Pv-fam-d protein [Plasmodium cynomolgi strain B]|uniref:Pv-fam-d protein n=1 Tax=Plasmodium cynomolgi (strain B) TaxID=1120755 RepID=K6UFC2_PLACD|nr:Pv-fam-d protein [Plasmodium cynomolgi strain B]GAB69846.1 Pv-fam-d protein [Plasmodium cynomolgi strain B]